MSGMVGGVRTALEVGRLLLSLDPLGDPMGCLLALGSYALASHQGEFLLELHRSRLPIGFSPARLANGLLSTTDGAGALACEKSGGSGWGEVAALCVVTSVRPGLYRKKRILTPNVNGLLVVCVGMF